MGRCDNPLKGIYNPYEIKKQSFCLSMGGGGFRVAHFSYLNKSVQKCSSITTSNAYKTLKLPFKHWYQTVLYSGRHSLQQ